MCGILNIICLIIAFSVGMVHGAVLFIAVTIYSILVQIAVIDSHRSKEHQELIREIKSIARKDHG